MKIAIRGGHSEDIRGASGVVDEVTEDRKITAKVIEYLRQLGHDVLDVTPTISGITAVDLSVAVNKSNTWGADYFCSIHLNAGGGKGTEVLYKSTKGKTYADRIVNKIASLGFTNRGSKLDTRGLYEFNHVIAPNNIIEVIFCDSQIDVDLYKSVGIDKIAIAIAEGITSQTVKQQPIIEEEKEVISLPNSFNRQFYLFANPDVAQALNEGRIESAEKHYLEYGYREGRACCPYIPQGFNAEQYLKNSPDVAQAIQNENIKSAEEHYLLYGVYEGRGWCSMQPIVIEKDVDKEELKNKIIDVINEVIK